ncbi:hypothetical protein [Robbsia andropogonis]|uniref:hypothetical protein n=1 Tax=Robbsia andropogonis TaxID=28092 RepID=UPI0004676721|nr:hypothetical protein [Robbsia andropogonis]
MDIYEIRLQNLRALAAECGGRPALAEFMGMSYQLLNNYLGKNPTKKIGDKTARRAEVVCGREHGWMDVQHILGMEAKEIFHPRVNEALIKSALSIGDWPFSFSQEKFSQLPPEKKARIDGFATAIIEEDSASKGVRKTG